MWPRTRVALSSLARQKSIYNAPLTRNAALRLPQRAFSARQFSSSSRNSAVYVQFGSGKGGKGPQKWDKHSAQTYLAGAIVGVGTIYYIAHLERVPETGRWRFMDVSPKIEERMGAEMLEAIIQKHGRQMLPQNHPTTLQVKAVVRRIIQSSGLGHIKGEAIVATDRNMNDGLFHSDERLNVDVRTPSDKHSSESKQKEWTVHVIHEDVPNAFTTFGGHIVVHTGILPVARDDDGLAAVVGHEIAHVVARHPSEKVSLGKVVTVVMGTLELLGVPGAQLLTSIILTFLVDLPNSRKAEYEADRIGMKLMARACFDPRAAPAMFARLGEAAKAFGGLNNMEFLQTHPLSQNRVQTLEALLPEAYAAQAENGLCGDTAQHFNGFTRALSALTGRGGGSTSTGTGWGSEFVDESQTQDTSASGEIIWK
ncbi:hypothetical protein EXIGLDRAFT_752543 [Exidia glandulosa HHB12029]|uniref:Peptidase M48 domain-containing protein n=2 Tax=Exidia glandulosa HHB12029 TaxID=1314781 RepID=A0A165EHN0_EXIGL|nr:hypothetical protein EXIGLDRAFT_752543 [Exidia glandulosa HHB12029]